MTRIRLNRKLHLETPQSVPDGAGGYRVIWQELGVMWGALEPVSSENDVSGDADQLATLYRMIVRAAPLSSPRRPKNTQRFKMGSRIFRITSVSEHDDKGRYLACLSKEERVL